MFNLIKMELYRFFKSTVTWIILGVSVAVLFCMVLFTSMDLKDAQESGIYAQQSGIVAEEGSDIIYMGIYFDTHYEWIDHDVNVSDFYIVTLQSCALLLIVTFFATIFTNGENKNGFVKNIAGRMRYKGKLFLSKLPAIFVFDVILFVCGYIFTALFVRILIGGVEFSITDKNVKILALQFLLHFAFSCVIAMLAVVSKSTALSATVGSVLSAGIGVVL